MQSFDHKSGKYLEIDGAKIYYEDIGNKSLPVLLMLHGGLGNIEHFNDLLAQLPDQFRVIGIDSRGHGMSTLGSSELTYALLQKEVETILEHLDINRLSIMGFSNGGTIAYRLAAFSNLQIDHLITIGSPWNTKHVEPIMQAFSMIALDDWINQCPSDYEKYKQLNPASDINQLFRKVVNLALDKSNNSRPNEAVRKIRCPLLAARGEHDPIVSKENIVELSELVNGSLILDIQSAGHEALIDQPKLFAKEILKFLL